MIKKYTNGSVTWVDVFAPTNEEVRTIMSEYRINPDTARELQLPTYKEKIVIYKSYLYMVLHFPALRHTNIDKTDQEIDFIVGKDFIITTRYEAIDALDGFSKTFELDKMLNKGLMTGHAGYALYHMIKGLYKAMSDEADSINDTLQFIDKDIFSGQEKKMVSRISEVSRDLISFNHTILTHKDVLMSLKDNGTKLFGDDFTENILRIINEYHRIEKNLVNNIEFLRELRNTNDSLLSSKQGESIKILTFLTFLALPVSIIENLFSMNTKNTPINGMANDWVIIVSIQVIVVAVIFFYSKHKKWI